MARGLRGVRDDLSELGRHLFDIACFLHPLLGPVHTDSPPATPTRRRHHSPSPRPPRRPPPPSALTSPRSAAPSAAASPSGPSSTTRSTCHSSPPRILRRLRPWILDIVRMGSGSGSMWLTASSWRGTSGRGDVFGWSVREEDDKEALWWAAIEKLPTYDRMRKGILTGAGQAQEVDIQGLGMQDRKNLIERLIRTAEEDNERFLLKLRDRMERVGIDDPTIEVRFDHLNIDAEAYVGNRGIPTFTNFFSNKVMDALSALRIVPSGKRPISILHDISGIIRPGRCSSFPVDVMK